MFTLTLELAFFLYTEKQHKQKRNNSFNDIFLKQQFEATWKNLILKVLRNWEAVVVKCSNKTFKNEKKNAYCNAVIVGSTHVPIGSPHITWSEIYIETHKFEKKIWNMYCNNCALKVSIDNLIGP